MDFDQAGLFAAAVEVIHCFFDGFTAGPHGDDDPVGIGRAIVIEELIIAACQFVDVIHIFLHDGRQGLIERIDGFPCLEVYVGILGRTA